MAQMGRIVLTEKPTKIISTVDDAVESDVVASQSKKFSTNYKSNKIEELYNEFDSVTLSKDQIEGSNARAIGMKKRQFKSRLILATSMIVAIMFAFLAIFNIFVIKDSSKGIESLQRDYATIENERQSVQANYDSTSDQAKLVEQLVKRGYRQING